MLSKFKKLFRTSKSLSPQKDLKEKDFPAPQDQLDTLSYKEKKKDKGKGKGKSSQPQQQFPPPQPEDSSDVVETQDHGTFCEDVEIVENEFKVENNDDEVNDKIGEEEGDDTSEGVVIEDESDIDDSFVGELVFEGEQKNQNFSCLSPIEIVAYQEKEVSDIADLLSVPASTSATLLRHFHWKRERFITRYLENPVQVCQTAGVPYVPNTIAKLRSLSTNKNLVPSIPSPAVPIACSICGDDELDPSNSSALSCNHTFCNECWGTHITTKINEGEPEIHCPHLKCNIMVPDSFVKKSVAPAVFDKYLRFVTKNFVRENDRVRWCPTPGCPHAITFDQSNSSSDSSFVQCACGYQFCFKCHHDAHAPATCEHMKLWDKESEIFNWRTINCRECPKCNVSVEKNGGCNHMTCQQCKYEWCWVCLRPWKGHNDFFNCDKHEKDLLEKGKRKSRRKKMEEERERKQIAMKRYLLYNERFEHHQETQKLEKELKVTAAEKMKQLQDAYTTKPEVQFIDKAVKELMECRSVLKYTYVFAYYLFADAPDGTPYKGAAKDLYENLQTDLEKTTDRLLEVIDGVMRRPEIETGLKLETINHTNLVRKKRENLQALARDALAEVCAD